MLRRFWRDQSGVAAVEAALIGSVVMLALFNGVEVGRYAFMSAEVAAASQAGAYAALAACDASRTPVTVKCPQVTNAVTAAVQGSSLGTAVALNGGLQEGWYCVSASGDLSLRGPASQPATACPNGAITPMPALYLRVAARFTYRPLFPGLTLVEGFSPTVDRTAWMRVV